MRYVAGLDGGGTKTAVAVADESGAVVATFESGGINYNGQDEASIEASLRDMLGRIGEAAGGLDRCAYLCIGAAGVSNPAVSARLTAKVRESGYAGGLLITGDQETALSGAHESEYGMILIAGTGSICYGRNERGETHRTGGCGHLIDDEGSGYAIGRDLLSVLVRAYDGRLPETVITDLVYAKLGLKTRSADSLAELVTPVAEKLALQTGALAMAGSVLLNNVYIRDAFLERLQERYPEITCLTPKKDAANGAVLMALNRLRGAK
ncbi:hypothetical protein BGX30_002257 [Mortierella sp. GBA39]|nr:hypothetical protein BGX30_002257 [Mortierella sp. GBA39]